MLYRPAIKPPIYTSRRVVDKRDIVQLHASPNSTRSSSKTVFHDSFATQRISFVYMHIRRLAALNFSLYMAHRKKEPRNHRRH